jgi:hypothetical protein
MFCTERTIFISPKQGIIKLSEFLYSEWGAMMSRHKSSLLSYAVSKSVLAPKSYVSRRLL